MRKICTAVTTALASGVLAFSSFAGTWVSDANGYRYQNEDGTFVQRDWIKDTGGRWFYIGDAGYMLHDQWIDGTYYVGSDGAMLTDTTTPDFYKVGKDGKYIAEDKPIEHMELTISRNGNDVSVIVEPGGGYTLESYSILTNDRLEVYLAAQKGYYFGIGKASQITLNGAKYESANRMDAMKHLRMTVALKDDEQIAADYESGNAKADEWVTAHTAELNLLIAYIQAGDNTNAIQIIHKLMNDHPVARFKYLTGEGVGLYGWGLTNSNNNPCNIYYGGLKDSTRQNVLCDREGNGTSYKLYVTNPSSQYDYLVFNGAWHNDAPNGPGSEYRHSKTGQDDLSISGNYMDWYEDGAMTRHYSKNDLTFHYTVQNRIPVSTGANGLVDTVNQNGTKYSLYLYDTVQTALMEYTGYQKGNGSGVRTN